MTCSETIYIESAQTKIDRLNRICQIIDGLELQQIAAISNSDIDEYQINDGQVVIKTIYRSATDIAKAIMEYEKIKQTLFNQLNGRGIVLRPWQGMV